MISLIKNYINKLSIDNLREFAFKNNINLTDIELKYLLTLVKENFDDILINENKYLNMLKNNININEYEKIKELFLYYKNRYKKYLF